MTDSSKRRLVLGVCATLATVTALVCGLAVIQIAVVETNDELLRAETGIAVELLRGAGSHAALDEEERHSMRGRELARVPAHLA